MRPRVDRNGASSSRGGTSGAGRSASAQLPAQDVPRRDAPEGLAGRRNGPQGARGAGQPAPRGGNPGEAGLRAIARGIADNPVFNIGATVGGTGVLYGGAQMAVATMTSDPELNRAGTQNAMLGLAVAFGAWGTQLAAHLIGNPTPAPVTNETLFEAMNMVTGHHPQTDLTERAGANRQNVINHLMDIATLPEAELHAEVRDAVEQAGTDGEQLVLNLLALLERVPARLSSRPSSAQAWPPKD